MAYSSIKSNNTKKSLAHIKPEDMHFANPNNLPRTDVNSYAFGHVFKRGWNYVSFPKFMQYTEFSDIFAQQYDITKIKSNSYALTRLEPTSDTWVGSTPTTVVKQRGYQIYNAGDNELQLAYYGCQLSERELNYKIKQTTDCFSVPLLSTPDKIEDGLAFDNSSVTLRSSGTGSASATTALTVADGDASISGVAEKQYLTLTSPTTATNEDGDAMYHQKTYVICDAGQPGCVATGTVLAEGSDTGGGTISAGSHLIGGIAVSTDLGPATYGAIINELRVAIMHANGHNGDITCGNSVTPADGEQSISLTQTLKGTRGNTGIGNTIANLRVNYFAGGASGTGPLINGIIGDGRASSYVPGVGFVGSLKLHPNTSVWIKMNDKPQIDNHRIFRDQGPDLTEPRFQAPPYDPLDMYGINFPHHLYDWEDYSDGWSIYIQGHWSYFNDGDPDSDYPYGPEDEGWGTYRVWIDGGEWTNFQIAYDWDDVPNWNIYNFGFDVSWLPAFLLAPPGQEEGSDQPQDSNGTFSTSVDLDSVESGVGYWELKWLDLLLANGVSDSITPDVYQTAISDSRSVIFDSYTSITFNGIGLTEDTDYTIQAGGDLRFINNLGSGPGALVINFKYDLGVGPSVWRNVNGDLLEPNFDAVACFKGPVCQGSFIKDDLYYDTLPLAFNFESNPDDPENWYNWNQNPQFFGYERATKAELTIVSSVEDGSNFPTDDTVALKLSSWNNEKTKYFLCSDVDDFDYTSSICKINCNQTRANIFASLKSAIEDSTDGMGAHMTATVGTDAITIKQKQVGYEGNTDVLWSGPTGDMSDTITVSGDNFIGSPIINFNGRFVGGGDDDIIKYVCWDGSTQKYYIMKWHHYNVTTGVETKYEYWEMGEKVKDGTLPDMTNSDGEDYSDFVQDPYDYSFVLPPNELEVITYTPSYAFNNWYLKAVEGEGW